MRRLSASVHLISASKCWVNTWSSGSSRSVFAISDRRHGQTDCSFHNRASKSWNMAIHSSAVEDDDFSELGPQDSERFQERIKLATAKLDDIKDDDYFSELDTVTPECSAKETELDSAKPDAFSDDAFSELGPGTSDCFAKKLKLGAEKLDNIPDDAFSELGPGTADCFAKQLKLVTEKRDRVPKAHSHSRELASKPLPSEAESSGGLITALGRNTPTSFTLPRSNFQESESADKSFASDYMPNPKYLFGVASKASAASPTRSRPSVDLPRSKPPAASPTRSRSSVELPRSKPPAASPTRPRSSVSETKYPLSVSLKNIPSEVGLPELIEAISVFGKVSGASFVTTSEKLKCCNIEFEDADSSRRAALAGEVKVGNRVFTVTPLGGVVDLVAVRIKNIKETTADSAVHSICKSTGELVGLSRTSKNGVDAFFNVQNHDCHLDIVKKLNNTVFDQNYWSASVLTDLPNSSKDSSAKEARRKLNDQIVDHFSMLAEELTTKRIILNDLEYLYGGIMCVKDFPPTPN